MNHFITDIHINRVLHLENLSISVKDENCPHLILTGKNGSGKTILLNALSDVLEEMVSEERQMHPSKRIDITVNDLYGIIENYKKGNFIIAFYQAERNGTLMEEPQSPTKPVIGEGIRKTSISQFLNFLVDLKFQELLALSNKNTEAFNAIQVWFGVFENILQEIYQDKGLRLSFDQAKRYTFKITTGNKVFGFNEMSDGFKAAINIVADLILRMQNGGKLSDAYKKEGIVLIDEIETHLHLELQKIIMPFLTKTFPNVQFIVTTHSPFVLSSMENAVAFDLEHQEAIEDLTDYSYSSLAEGYFGVRSESNTVRTRLDELTMLLSKEKLSSSEQVSVKILVEELDKIPEPASPSVVGEYVQLKLNNIDKIKTILAL